MDDKYCYWCIWKNANRIDKCNKENIKRNKNLDIVFCKAFNRYVCMGG